jgi:hypothetical protein
MTSARRRWTEVSELLTMVRRRWDSSRYLRAHAMGEAWEPIVLPVRGPTSADLQQHFDEARSWAAVFERDAAACSFEIEHRVVRGRSIGASRVPARTHIRTFDQLCKVLGTADQVKALDCLLEMTSERRPELVDWARQHPLQLLEHEDAWERILATISWIGAHDTRHMYLRQMDVGGVDTKFVEGHHRLITKLLQVYGVEDGGLAEPGSGAGAVPDFARRFGFLAKPSYVRLRFLDPERSPFPRGISEVTMRSDELAGFDVRAETVFVIENEVSYLAIPEMPCAVAVFGSGFRSAGLGELPWLADTEVVYWGDIDTHGYDILSRLRALLPKVSSILMDHHTLLSHQEHWTVEPSPTHRALDHLTESEQAVYQDLVQDVYGRGIRLEQERVRYHAVEKALAPWSREWRGSDLRRV